MSSLIVRTYNVRFGDAFLVSVPDEDASGNAVTRHILIDFGNLQSAMGEAGADVAFEPVVDNILEVLNGRPLDLYIMTHEHMDHIQGPLFAHRDHHKTLRADYVWMTASAKPNYYDTHPDARKAFNLTKKALKVIEQQFKATPAATQKALMGIFLNNSPHVSQHCVDFIRKMAPEQNVHYVHRGCNVAGTHPFRVAGFDIWAPEENTSEYYGHFQPMAFGTPGLGVLSDESADAEEEGAGGTAGDDHAWVNPPAGVDAGSFYDLVDSRSRGLADNLFTIDKAKNNTSIVFVLEWRGWRLLFSGDAEHRSWKTMNKDSIDVLRPVDFLKVSHHASHTGTPEPEILEKILPAGNPDGVTPRFAVVSTHLEGYSGVPDDDTLDALAERCSVESTEGMDDGDYFDIEFPP